MNYLKNIRSSLFCFIDNFYHWILKKIRADIFYIIYGISNKNITSKSEISYTNAHLRLVNYVHNTFYFAPFMILFGSKITSKNKLYLFILYGMYSINTLYRTGYLYLETYKKQKLPIIEYVTIVNSNEKMSQNSNTVDLVFHILEWKPQLINEKICIINAMYPHIKFVIDDINDFHEYKSYIEKLTESDIIMMQTDEQVIIQYNKKIKDEITNKKRSLLSSPVIYQVFVGRYKKD